MLVSTFLYLGCLVCVAGLISLLKPMRWAGIPSRGRALILIMTGLGIAGVTMILPAPAHRATSLVTRLDEFTPVWQFREYHAREVAAPQAEVFEAIKRIRPDEILLFRTLIRIRNCCEPTQPGVVDATRRFESLIDIATHSTFVYLADDPPREFVIGTVVGWPRGADHTVKPEIFRESLPPGFALATMNYIVRPAVGGSIVSTETRVFANSPSARRRFAAYWRIIYPGSALMRRMMLCAVDRRATAGRSR